MPLDQLEQTVLEQASRVTAHLGGHEDFADSMGLEETVEDAGTPLGSIDSSMVRAASEALVSQGLLSLPTDRVSKDMRRALQALADKFAPGLYDVVADDKDLLEVIKGVANGTFGNGADAGQ